MGNSVRKQTEPPLSNLFELRQIERSEATQSCEQYLVFSNPGKLALNLVKLMGVTVKEGNDPIGFFGTGLKYAMATALLLGGSMIIITGGPNGTKSPDRTSSFALQHGLFQQGDTQLISSWFPKAIQDS